MTDQPASSLAATHTTTALLDALQQSDHVAAWQALDVRLRPLILMVARRMGLAEADAADVAQDTLVQFLAAYRDQRYVREQGRLSSWVLGIARHRILQARERLARQRGIALSSAPELSDRDLQATWNDEAHRLILRDALLALRAEKRLHARTIEAFEAVAIHQHPAADVAARLKMNINEVYVAKHRCVARLRQLVAALTASYDLTEPDS